MPVNALEKQYFYTNDNFEKANSIVERILASNALTSRSTPKTNYSNINLDGYSSVHKDWSNLTDSFLSTVKSKNNPMFVLWCGIKARCYDENSFSYCYYGARGIEMSPEWKENFNTFASDILNSIGKKPQPYYTIDRINGQGNYELNNVRWVSPLKQARNRNKVKISEVSALAIATIYKYYRISGRNLQKIYNDYIAEDEEHKLTKTYGPIYAAAKSYNEFV